MEKWLSSFILLCAIISSSADPNEDTVWTEQLKLANVELAKNTATRLVDGPSSSGGIGEQLYRMIFKRDTLNDESKEPKKTEEDSNQTTTPIPPDHKNKAHSGDLPDHKNKAHSGDLPDHKNKAHSGDLPDHKNKAHTGDGKAKHHKGHKKHKHKHHHKHHKSDNGTEIDWHSIG